MNSPVMVAEVILLPPSKSSRIRCLLTDIHTCFPFQIKKNEEFFNHFFLCFPQRIVFFLSYPNHHFPSLTKKRLCSRVFLFSSFPNDKTHTHTSNEQFQVFSRAPPWTSSRKWLSMNADSNEFLWPQGNIFNDFSSVEFLQLFLRYLHEIRVKMINQKWF